MEIRELLQEVHRELQGKPAITSVMVTYSDFGSGPCLAITAFLHSPGWQVASSIEWAMTDGANQAIQLCRKVGLPLREVLPSHFATTFSGIVIDANGIRNPPQ